MEVIICVDDHYGVSFLGKRLSRDKFLYADIAEYINKRTLCVNAKAAALFQEQQISLKITTDFSEDSLYFVEDTEIFRNRSKISKIILYRWNRIYPSDVRFSPEWLDEFQLINRTEFAGFSHDLITREVYCRG